MSSQLSNKQEEFYVRKESYSNYFYRTENVPLFHYRLERLSLYRVDDSNSSNQFKRAVRIADNFQCIFRILKRENINYWSKIKNTQNKDILVPLEVELLLRAKSTKHCLNLIDFIIERDLIYLIYELNDSKQIQNLTQFIQSRRITNLYEIVFIVYDLINAFLELKQHGIIPLQIRPDNLLVCLNEHNQVTSIKLFDFNSALNFTSNELVRMFGEDIFYPPEWHTTRSCYAENSLVWSLGMLLYYVYFKKLPYESIRQSTQRARLKFVDYDTEGFNQSRNDLIRKCLSRKPKERISLNGILKHEYFSLVKKSELKLDNHEFGFKLNKLNFIEGVNKLNSKEIMVKKIDIKFHDQDMPNELFIIRQVKNCSNCLRLVDEIYIGRLNCFYVIYESLNNYVDIYDLRDQLENDTEMLRKYARKIVSGILEMRNKFVYYLTAPNSNNIFVNVKTEDLKIVDFSRDVYWVPRRKLKNSDFNYKLAPPEKDAKECDADLALVWYIGLQLYVLKFNKLPFESIDSYEDILSMKLDYVSSDFYNLVSDCLKKDANKRLNLNKVMSHRWLK